MTAQRSARNIKWIEGLRGLASFLVVVAHLGRGWGHDVYSPTSEPNAPPRALQYPIVRIPLQGGLGLTTFAVLTGFICALKPLKLAREGNYHSALVGIAKGVFRRPPRLIMPAAIAMIIAWVLTQLGAFTVAHRCDAPWLRAASPRPDPSLFSEIKRLFRVFLATWTNGHMDYDDHQWALLPLLKGAMEAYVVLAPVIFMKYRYRMLVYAIMIYYFHQSPKPDTETFGQQVFFGMMLCDFMLDERAQKFLEARVWARSVASTVLIATGLYFASYPAEHSDWAPWSRNMKSFGELIFPPGTNFTKRFDALAIDCIILGICLSQPLRDMLSTSQLLFCGKHSYAVYMIHGTLLRTVLVWLFYGISGQPWWERENAETGEMEHAPYLPRRSAPWMALSLAVWFPMVYGLAHLWMTYVDTWCARVTQRLEDRMFEGEKNAPMLG